MATAEYFYSPDHPTAQGHFPGNPIIPGAVLLSDALKTIGTSLGVKLTLSRIKAAKFHAPTRPGDRVLIEFAFPVAGKVTFACTVNQITVLTGEALCDSISTAN